MADLNSDEPSRKLAPVAPRPQRRTPTVRGRQLGIELKRLRISAGLTADQVADRLDCSQGKISRIELAQTGVSKGDLFLMLTQYGVTEAARQEQFWRLAREARGRGWWEDYRDIIASSLSTYIAFEAEASSLRTWSWGTINGLLQTEDYARATFMGEPAGRHRTPEQVAKLVQARLERQQRLAEGSIGLWAVLDESLLRRPIGGHAVLQAQLDHLLVPRANVTIQVLTQQTVWHTGLNGAFTIMGFPSHPSVVFVESLTGDLDVESQEDVARFTLAFDYLRAAAASVEESPAIIARARDEIGRDG